jgi:cell division transport system permease protein
MLLAAAVLVAFATIRLAIDARLAEIRVLALIGATRAQLRRPFLYLGSAFGLGGGMMAIVLMAVFLNQIEAPLESLLVSYGSDPELSAFTPQIILLVLTAGWLLGITGALLALIQRLGMKNSG